MATPTPCKTRGCVEVFDRLWWCLSPINQIREYYMNGEFDTCEGKLNALYYCMKNKVVNDPELAERVEVELKGGPGKNEPPVWKLKEKPGWY